MTGSIKDCMALRIVFRAYKSGGLPLRKGAGSVRRYQFSRNTNTLSSSAMASASSGWLKLVLGSSSPGSQS